MYLLYVCSFWNNPTAPKKNTMSGSEDENVLSASDVALSGKRWRNDDSEGGNAHSCPKCLRVSSFVRNVGTVTVAV